MIEQNSNVIKDPNIKRIVEYTENSKQVNILDSRFYRRSEKYYPSVTSILTSVVLYENDSDETKPIEELPCATDPD